MELIKIKDSYLNFVEVSFSKGTHECYSCHLNYLTNWLIDRNITSSEKITNDILCSFILEQKKFNVENSTINKRLQVLKRALIFNKININDLNYFSKLREKKAHFRSLSDKELILILNYLKTSNLKLSNKILILVLLDTGIRINEALSLRKSSFNENDKSLYLSETKTKINRTVYLTDNSFNLLKEYVKSFHDNDLIFNLTKSGVSSLFNRIRKGLDLNKFHPHMLRHTYASILVSNEISVFVLMELMGHKNVQTTMRYVHLTDNFRKESYSKCMKY